MAVSKSLRYQVLRRDNFTCRYCGRRAPEVVLVVDHVVAEALGGRDEPSNLVAACAECNGGKAATPADAAVVSDVEADAIRWARAVSVAADHMLDDVRAREANQNAFESRWNEWESSRGVTPALPSDWRLAVDRFVAAGLPLAVLLECVDRAMANRQIRHDSLFRYMCGIAWARVAEIQESARAAVRGVPAIELVDDRLANILIGSFGEDGFAEIRARAVAALTDAGIDGPSEYTVLLQCVEELTADLWGALAIMGQLELIARRSVPEDKLDALLIATTQELQANLSDDYSEVDYQFNLVRNALIGLGELAKRAGGTG